MNSKWYIYGWVLKDLSPAQRAIQFGHAVLESASIPRSDRPLLSKSPPNMVLFGADSEAEMVRIMTTLQATGIRHRMFYEPDVDKYTALVTEPVMGEAREFFRDFELLRD